MQLGNIMITMYRTRCFEQRLFPRMSLVRHIKHFVIYSYYTTGYRAGRGHPRNDFCRGYSNANVKQLQKNPRYCSACVIFRQTVAKKTGYMCSYLSIFVYAQIFTCRTCRTRNPANQLKVNQIHISKSFSPTSSAFSI